MKQTNKQNNKLANLLKMKQQNNKLPKSPIKLAQYGVHQIYL